MGNLVVNCKYDLGNIWNPVVEKTLETIREFASDSGGNVEIESVKRIGCDLLVNCSFPTFDKDGEHGFYDRKLVYAVEGSLHCCENKLRVLCPKCGKDKGLPPSFTVRPGFCEECRSKIVPSDYKNNVIVCMSGKAGSGKDTVADYLVSKHGFVRTAFADPLRDIVQLVFVLDHDSVWDRKLRELPLKYLPNYTNKEVKESVDAGFVNFPNLKPEEVFDFVAKFGYDPYDTDFYWSVRKLLQFIGTEMFRNMINRDTWVMNFTQRIEPGVNYVLTDCRFPNELEWVKSKFGGKVIFVEVVRQGCDGKGVGLENHESERYKLPADVVLENNGTLEELYDKIQKVVLNKV